MPALRSDRRRRGVVAAVPWVLWAGLRLTGTERGFPLVPAMAFTPYAAATSVLPLGLAIRDRSRAGVLLAAGAGAALGAAVLRRGAGRRDGPVPGGPRDGDRLRLATVSLRRGLVAAESVLDLVRTRDVDVLSVQELTPGAERALRAAGIDELLPHAHVVPARPGAVPSASGAVWSRWPVLARDTVPGEFEQPTVRLPGGDGPDVEVTAVHLAPPATSPAAVRKWTADLAGLPAPDAAVLRVLAGDFNATPDHAALREMLGRGYVDAASVTGRGRAWTWRPLRLPHPRLALDHVLVDPRITVTGFEPAAVAGSDHRALVVELRLPPRPA